MTSLIDSHYSERASVSAFYLDRAARLFPQFLFYLLSTLLLISVAHPSSPYISGLSAAKAALNIAMLPLNFYRYFPDGLIIPQAWSLGLESQFYLVIPLLIIFRARALAFVTSMTFFLLPYFGILNSDTWGYRMIPGTLFMFLFGSFLRRRTNTTALLVAYVAVCALFACVATHRSLQLPFTFEVLAGLVCGIPIVWVLPKIKFGRLEEMAGNLSYGVFLNHFFVMWVFQSIGIHSDRASYVYDLVATSLALSAISYSLAERPFVVLRRSLRNRLAPVTLDREAYAQ